MVKIKQGSSVVMPMAHGLTLSSDTPGVVTVTPGPNSVTLTATGTGTAWLTLEYGGDVRGSLKVQVS